MNRSSRIPTGAAALALCVSAAGLRAQTVVESFEGDRGPGLAVCQTGVMHCGLAEMDAAANGKQVVQVTWQNVRVYNYHGKLLHSTAMTDLVRKAGLDPVPPPAPRPPAAPVVRGPIEPHVAFDEFIGRWIITITGISDTLVVSASADATGAWGGVNLACLNGGPCLNFDPALHLGYDRNGVYYCGGHAGEANPLTIPGYAYDCLAVPAAEVAAIGAGHPPVHIYRAHNLPLDVMPAIDHNRRKAADAPAFFLAKTCDRSVPGGCQNAKNYPFQWIVDSFTWHGAQGAFDPEQTVRTDVGSQADRWLYNRPCCGPLGVMPQAGSGIPLRAMESHRLSNLVQSGSHLYGAMASGPCTAQCGEQGVDTNNVLFWFDLDCPAAGSCAVNQTGKIAGGFNPEFATVGVDAAGNLGIVAASSTAATDLSLLLWTRRPADPPGTFRGPETIAAGTRPYTCDTTPNFGSIGNAAGVLTALDPADATKLWTAGQYGNDAAACVWTTRIVEYQIANR